KEAADKLPGNPIVLYHYGMAEHQSENAAAAKTLLQSSLKLSDTYPGAEEAKKVLATLLMWRVKHPAVLTQAASRMRRRAMPRDESRSWPAVVGGCNEPNYAPPVRECFKELVVDEAL